MFEQMLALLDAQFDGVRNSLLDSLKEIRFDPRDTTDAMQEKLARIKIVLEALGEIDKAFSWSMEQNIATLKARTQAEAAIVAMGAH